MTALVFRADDRPIVVTSVASIECDEYSIRIYRRGESGILVEDVDLHPSSVVKIEVVHE